MTRSLVVVAGLVVLLGGCADGAADFGATPPVTLVTAREDVTVAARGSEASKLRLRQRIDLIAQGNLQAVRASIVASSAAQIKALKSTLIGLGLDPVHIVGSISLERRSRYATVALFRTTAIPADCAAAIETAFPDDPTYSLSSLSHCVQDNNLAEMVVDPADLVAPSRLGPADGAYLADGMRSWRENRRSQLPGASTSAGLNSGLGASSGSSTAPTAPVNSSTSPNTRSP
ncbi:CpaD family pilus assembly lipoprotein [Bradyrhizobium sp. STM 3557]|uniref:CpaD family pilus assembly lipoprotein n=1 Tax=Bradyrhizobium sp. STM 3557 TaxID=578920 RepID=UPI003890FBF8